MKVFATATSAVVLALALAGVGYAQTTYFKDAIPAAPTATTPGAGDYLPLVQAGATKKLPGNAYAPATSGTSILKGNNLGGTTAAVPGVDYLAPGSGIGSPSGATGAVQYNNSGAFGGVVVSGLIKGNGSSAPSAAVAGTDYLVPGGALGTPSSVNLANATNLPISGISGLNAGAAAWLQIPSSANLSSALTTKTGTGLAVFGTGPTLSNVTLNDVIGSAQCIHANAAGVLSGTGSDCGAGGGGTSPGGTAGAIQYNNAGVFGGIVLTGLVKANGTSAPTAAAAGTDYLAPGGALGTPSSANLANATGYQVANLSGVATGFSTWAGTPNSNNLRALMTDETGAGAAVFATSPTLVTPALGTPSAVDLTNATNIPGAQLGANSVTNAKLGTMAAHTYKGNNTGSTTTPTDVTAAQVAADLPAVVGDSGSGETKGLVPAPLAGDAAAGKFLKADGTFAIPAGGSGTPGGSSGQLQYNNAGSFGGVTVGTGLDMTSGTLSLVGASNDQTGAAGGNYTINATDNQKTVFVTGGGTTTFPQAGTTGFPDKYSTCVSNAGTSTTLVSTTTSQFKGIGVGTATSFTLDPGGWVCPTSDATNWNTVGQIRTGTDYAASWTAGFNPNGSIVFTAARPMLITGVTGKLTAATGTAATLMVRKATSSQTCDTGVDVLSASVDANASAPAAITPTLTGTSANLLLNANDSVCLRSTQTTEWTGGSSIGSITVTVRAR